MFSGMTNHSIDAKGRIVLPAKFREQLGETYYLARGFGNKCIQVMSSEQFNAMCEKILALPANLSMAVQYTFNATAVEVTPNAQGRVIIPQSLRKIPTAVRSQSPAAAPFLLLQPLRIWQKLCVCLPVILC